MKKIFSVVFAFLIFAVCFAFVSCSERPDGIVGKWELKMAGDSFGSPYGSESGGLTGEVKVFMTFEENGEYTVEIDRESYRSFIKDNLETIYEAMGMTVEDALEYAGVTSEDALVESLVASDAMNDAGEYSLEDGVLTVRGSDGTESRIKVELDGSSLIFEEILDEDGGTSYFYESDLPLTLNRVG